MPNKNNFYAVILAGGSGTRFWPLSRHEEPKQFLKIIGNKSLLQETVSRLKPLIPPSRVLIVTNRLYQKKVAADVREFKIPKQNILLEPEGKNTAPAIAWAARLIHAEDPNAVMAVLPSDHLIAKTDLFLKLLEKAYILAEENYLVTMGIVPDRPETGYGYLKTSRSQINGKEIVKVDQFVEKPDAAKAREFLKSGNYLWNSGMFFWKTETILKAFDELLPSVGDFFKKNSPAAIQKKWKTLPSISIDYGILEKSSNGVTVPASDIGWSDLGSWEALVDMLTHNPQWSSLSKEHVSLDCKKTFVFAKKKIVATIGLEGITIVETPDALLVCRTDQSQKVKDVVADLKSKGRPEWVRHKKGR